MDNKSSQEDEKKKKQVASGLFSLLAETQSTVVSIQPSQSSSVTSAELPGDFQVLFEQLSDALIHEQNNGISETIVHINTANSRFIFNGSQFRILHYDTAPHSFNIQFCGSESSVSYFQKHMGELALALQKNLREFQINFATPILQTEENTFSRKKANQLKVNKTEKSISNDHRKITGNEELNG